MSSGLEAWTHVYVQGPGAGLPPLCVRWLLCCTRLRPPSLSPMMFEDGHVFLTIEFGRCHNSGVIVTLNPVESKSLLSSGPGPAAKSIVSPPVTSITSENGVI